MTLLAADNQHNKEPKVAILYFQLECLPTLLIVNDVDGQLTPKHFNCELDLWYIDFLDKRFVGADLIQSEKIQVLLQTIRTHFLLPINFYGFW